MVVKLIKQGMFLLAFTCAILLNACTEPADGQHPMKEFIQSGDIRCVRLSLEYLNDISEPLDDRGHTALHIACNGSHDDIANFLIEHNANVNAMTPLGVSVLHFAAANGTPRTVALLLRAGANHLLEDIQGYMPIGYARYRIMAADVGLLSQQDDREQGEQIVSLLSDPEQELQKYNEPIFLP